MSDVVVCIMLKKRTKKKIKWEWTSISKYDSFQNIVTIDEQVAFDILSRN